MRKLKNNKGLTGIDIVVSISLIVIVLGIVIAVYSSYSNKAKEVKRTSIATNLAMTVIESIEAKNIEEIEADDFSGIINIEDGYGVGADDDVPNGYSITAKKVESTNTILKDIAFQVDVTVSYKVKKEEKKITLSTVKKYDDYKIREAVPPDLTQLAALSVGGKNDEFVYVKKDTAKGGYVKVDFNDSDWYSISSKILPIAVILKQQQKFDINGVINLNQCDYIFAWVPYFGEYDSRWRFCDASGKIIEYIEDSSNSISKYTLSESNIINTTNIMGGKWQRLNENEETIDNYGNITNGEDIEIIKSKVFYWE